MRVEEKLGLPGGGKRPGGKGMLPVKLTKTQWAIVAGTALALYLLLFSGSGGGESASAPPGALQLTGKKALLPDFVKKSEDLSYILVKAREMQADVSSFWLEHGLDVKHGGFYGTLDRQGKPTSPSYKGLIQQTRHLMSMCYLAEHFGAGGRVGEVAAALYAFLRDSFLDASTNTFFYIVSPDGREKLEPGKQLYANMHAIAALAFYGRVFKSQEALNIARKSFEHWDSVAHDATNGGWDESKDVPRLKSDDARTVKGVDTHLHALDAMLRLEEAGEDALVAERKAEALDLFLHKFVAPDTNLMVTEFSAEWRALPEAANHVSYGHDYTAVWLLAEATKAGGALSEADKARLVALGQYGMDKGYDTKQGGFYEYGADDGTVVGRDHTWWVQCQGMLAAWKLYEMTCEPAYLAKLKGTMQFVDQYMWDKKHGEWFWGITEFGEVTDRGTNKGNEWKASVHTVRTLVLLDRWITAGPVCRSTA